MAYFLGDLVDTNKAEVKLIYGSEPSSAVQNSFDAMIQGTLPQKADYKYKKATLYMNPSTSELYYEYTDRPLTDKERVEQDVSWIAQVSTKDKVIAGSLTDDELIKLSKLYPEWEVGKSYNVDDVISYHNELYKVIQAHTSQSDWTPDVVASLFTKVSPDGVIAEWSQPTGAHDAYNTGDQVTWKNSTWQSDIDANVWEPGVYGWTQI